PHCPLPAHGRPAHPVAWPDPAVGYPVVDAPVAAADPPAFPVAAAQLTELRDFAPARFADGSDSASAVATANKNNHWQKPGRQSAATPATRATPGRRIFVSPLAPWFSRVHSPH